jgi:hypothetical protein
VPFNDKLYRQAILFRLQTPCGVQCSRRRTFIGVTATLCGTETALAQHTAALPSMKTIGTPAAPAERATPNSE